MRDEFSRFHPIVNLIFFTFVLCITMFQMQIALIAISLICSVIYHFYLKGFDGIRYAVMVLIVFVTSAFINPLFSHKGATLLFYLFTGNPVTLESVIYGMSSAAMISAMLFWFSALNTIVTSDKLLAGIGKTMPNISTLISMVLRFTPKFVRHWKDAINVNKALGNDAQSFRDKIKTQADIFSITTTWALENSVDTADSMRARGYGTGKRSSYSNYKKEVRDYITIIWMLVLFSIILYAIMTDRVVTYYYPAVRSRGVTIVYITYGLLCMTPMIIDLWEAFRWHRLKLEI